jgi:CDP-diacylglycerol--serine O-phosphatidyltransferase
MNIRSQIPNLFTMANLVCGAVATIYVAQFSYFSTAIFLVFLAGFFDLLDGAIARALHVSGEMGKQLDSLADVVSFGLVPTVVIYKLLEESLPAEYSFLRFVSLINVVSAAYRLAKFNISKDQTHDFSGMPSPANGIFWASIMAIMAWSRVDIYADYSMIELPIWSIMLLTLLTSFLMISKIRMFSFKFKPGGIKANLFPVSFLILVLLTALVCTFTHLFLVCIPISILLYMVMSVFYHFSLRTDALK